MPENNSLILSITEGVKKFDPYEIRMNELKEKYCGLKINGIEDKEGIEQNKLAIAELRTIRVNTEKDRKDIKAPFLKAASSIDAKAQWIMTGISAIEEPLKAEKKKIQDELERLARIEQDRINEVIKKRVTQLSEMGAIFNGVEYILGDVSYSLVNIAGSDEDIYQSKILPRYKEIFDKNESIRLSKKPQTVVQYVDSADKDKYAETINYLKATPIYEMRSGQYRQKMRIINDFLADLK